MSCSHFILKTLKRYDVPSLSIIIRWVTCPAPISSWKPWKWLKLITETIETDMSCTLFILKTLKMAETDYWNQMSYQNSHIHTVESKSRNPFQMQILFLRQCYVPSLSIIIRSVTCPAPISSWKPWKWLKLISCKPSSPIPLVCTNLHNLRTWIRFWWKDSFGMVRDGERNASKDFEVKIGSRSSQNLLWFSIRFLFLPPFYFLLTGPSIPLTLNLALDRSECLC